MAERYGQLGGEDGAHRPEGWYDAPDGSRWAMYAVYYSETGRLRHAAYWAGRVVGLVFAERVAMGPRQPRRFTRLARGEGYGSATSAEWFRRSVPFGHPREVVAAAEAAGQPFDRRRVWSGASVRPGT